MTHHRDKTSPKHHERAEFEAAPVLEPHPTWRRKSQCTSLTCIDPDSIPPPLTAEQRARPFTFQPAAAEYRAILPPLLHPTELIDGPFKQSRCSHGPPQDSRPENPNQQALRCPNCLLTLGTHHQATNSRNSSGGAYCLYDVWTCRANQIKERPNPCQWCPCTNSVTMRHRMWHRCQEMEAAGELGPVFLRPGTMQRQPETCEHCHTVCLVQCLCKVCNNCCTSSTFMSRRSAVAVGEIPPVHGRSVYRGSDHSSSESSD
eukprot:c20221_g1_i1.p2 GENE.c20221_g1_i1~~c20221_g1_i1.p2  ORF type:complete len:260 (+),score=15.48 c20221_g1_i1:368-1147(+)